MRKNVELIDKNGNNINKEIEKLAVKLLVEILKAEKDKGLIDNNKYETTKKEIESYAKWEAAYIVNLGAHDSEIDDAD